MSVKKLTPAQKNALDFLNQMPRPLTHGDCHGGGPRYVSVKYCERFGLARCVRIGPLRRFAYTITEAGREALATGTYQAPEK